MFLVFGNKALELFTDIRDVSGAWVPNCLGNKALDFLISTRGESAEPVFLFVFGNKALDFLRYFSCLQG